MSAHENKASEGTEGELCAHLCPPIQFFCGASCLLKGDQVKNTLLQECKRGWTLPSVDLRVTNAAMDVEIIKSSPHGQWKGQLWKIRGHLSRKRSLETDGNQITGKRYQKRRTKYFKGKIGLFRVKSLLLIFLLNAITPPTRTHCICVTSSVMTEHAVTTSSEVEITHEWHKHYNQESR